MAGIPSFDLKSTTSFSGEGTADQGANTRTGGVRSLINTNIATGGSSLAAGLSAEEGFDWKLIAILAATGAAAWYILKRQ